MPVMSGTVSVVANTVTTNQLAGRLFEFLSKNSAINLAVAAAVTGLNATFTIGGTTVLQDSLVGFANRFPQLLEDSLVQVNGRRGARLFLTFRNTTGSDIIVNWLLNIR